MCASSRRASGSEARQQGDASAGPLPLGLRNRLAELILDAFESGETRATLSAVARACGPSPDLLDAGDVDRLLRLGWFEPVEAGRVRLIGAHRGHARTLGGRAGRAVAAVAGWQEPGGEATGRLLARASALANHGLYFEVHELLEPAWFRAADPMRTALQGLIQVAVAFHHLEHGNHEGARSLLGEGVAKVSGSGAALPLDLTGWLGELRVVLATLAAGGLPAAVPRWPSPRLEGEIQWRSS